MTLAATREATATRQLGELCAGIRADALPGPVLERAKELTLDLLGVAARGSQEASSRPGHAVAWSMQPAGEASVVGGGFGTGAVWAAMANGTSAHAIEMDDVTTESSLHPGVAVIPAAFALAEERRLAPSAFLEAVVAGYEITMRVGNALTPASAYKRGFHPTGVGGVVGAAVAAGKLLGLDAEAVTRAIGIAGTMATGSLEYLSDGAWTKRLNPGWAAHGGIVAAHLAAEGFTGPSTAIEGALGTLHAYSDAPRPERLLADLGDPPQIMRVSIKPYACCRYNHGLIDCVIRLRQEHGIEPADVARIRLGVLSGGALLVADPIDQKRTPNNVVDAQFSAPYAAAVALVYGRGGREVYTQENVEDATIRELMARTDCYTDASLDAPYPYVWPSAAEIELRDGTKVSTRVEHASGEPENPVSRDGLVAKFTGLAGDRIGESNAAQLAPRILRLEEEPDLRGIGRALRG